MPSRNHYLTLAKQVREDLDSKHLAFRSYRRREITDRLRKISGEPTTRIKQAGMAKEIEDVFRDQGLRVYPRLSETGTDDDVRVWRAGTLAAEVLDLILYPGEGSDKELAGITQKVKGKWEWSTPYPLQGAEPVQGG